MICQYVQIGDDLGTPNIKEVDALFPNVTAHNRICDLRTKLKDFGIVTKQLQIGDVTASKVASLFDVVVENVSQIGTRLGSARDLSTQNLNMHL